MWKMPRFTKCIRARKVHSVHMALGFLCSVCFQNLHGCEARKHFNIELLRKKERLEAL